MGKVVHFEIPFDDKQRAMKFYGDCFGWRPRQSTRPVAHLGSLSKSGRASAE